jgi:iron complex transport system substrate-binding protein
VPFTYNGLRFERGLRPDLIVDRCVVVEVKSVEHVAAVHSKQLLTYLRILDLRVGLLLNFGRATMKSGLKRVVNNFVPFAASASSSRLRVSPRSPDGT